MLIAIPSDNTNGLEAVISEHFGHCAAFTLVTVDDGAVGDVSILENTGHQEGGCMAPVNLLKENGVDVLIAGGMGPRPLAGFQQVGIDVLFREGATSVKEAVNLFLEGGCRSFGEAQTCGGGEAGCGSHDHDHQHQAQPQIVPIEGPADIREGRLVTLDYVLKDADGTLLEDSENSGPMRFIFGANQTLPMIEKAVFGLEPQARVVQDIPAAEAFGEHDEDRIIEVPRANLPPDASVGEVVAGQDQSGRQFPLTVLHIGDEVARLDTNHPFAGKDLVFDLTVKKVEGLKKG